MEAYVFHVLHNARPEYEMDVLSLLENGQESTYEAMLSEGQELGLSIGYQVKTERQLRDVLQLLRSFDLMKSRSIQLTLKGQIVAQLAYNNPDLFPEIIHYLYYSTWHSTRETESCFSWSYRTLCNYLWKQGATAEDKPALFSVVSSEASAKFQIQTVSFSTNSVTGILIWLESLNPPVIEYGDKDSKMAFKRRAFCPPELFVLALDFVYRENEVDYGANLLLNDARRDEICQICLLEPGSFDRVLDYAAAQFDYLEKGLGGGWGHYLTLLRQPKLVDFV